MAERDNNRQLEELREKWQNGDAKMKEKLKSEILKKEEIAETLSESIKKAVNEVRQEEQKAIR